MYSAFSHSNLSGIEDSRRLLHVIPRELFDQLLPGKEFLIPVRPAKSDQIIDHGIGQIAHVFIRHNRRGAVAF